jgi:acyl-CoA thioester hydrolase
MLSTTFDVRFYETDALKHVSNTAIVGWFETARMPIFKWFTPNLDLDNWPLILANYNVDFLLQIYLGEAVEIKTGVNKIGNSSFKVYQEVWQSNELKAKGETTLVHFDYKQQKASPIPDDVRDKLAEILVEQR